MIDKSRAKFWKFLDMDRSNSDDELLKRVAQDFMSPSSHMAMPPKGDNLSLTEVQLRDALKYMKIVFGR